MSTNDTVLLLASGASGIEPTAEELTAAVTAVCHDLAQQLLADAEGATKEVAIEVRRRGQRGRRGRGRPRGRPQQPGQDRAVRQRPELGPHPRRRRHHRRRVRAGRLDVAINGVWVCRGGAAAEDRAKVDLTGRGVTVRIDLHAGADAATIWTNDLSHAYVHENSAYSHMSTTSAVAEALA